jgi:hypothetical protein
MACSGSACILPLQFACCILPAAFCQRRHAQAESIYANRAANCLRRWLAYHPPQNYSTWQFFSAGLFAKPVLGFREQFVKAEVPSERNTYAILFPRFLAIPQVLSFTS